MNKQLQLKETTEEFAILAPDEENTENVNLFDSIVLKTQSGRSILNKEELNKKALSYLEKIVNVEPKSPEAEALIEEINRIGMSDLRKFSNSNNHFLNTLMNDDIKSDELMNEFKNIMTSLNPYKEKKKSFFTLIENVFYTFCSKVLNIEKLEKDKLFNEKDKTLTKKILDDTMSSLYTTKNSLLRKNATIEVEKEDMDIFIDTVEGHIYFFKALNLCLDDYIKKQGVNYGDYLKNDFSFAIKQKEIDIMTYYAVNIQTYLSLDVVLKQNEVLINWIDKASTINLEALKTALVNENYINFTKEAKEFISKTTEFESLIENQNSFNEEFSNNTNQILKINEQSINEKRSNILNKEQGENKINKHTKIKIKISK